MPHNIRQRIRIPPFYQIILIVISALVTSYFLYHRLVSYYPHDPKPVINALTPEKIAEFGGYQGAVNVGLYINKFEKADFTRNEFIFTGIIWFEFNPDVISLATLEKFSFENGEILDRSKPETRVMLNKLMVRYNIKVRFGSVLDYRDFPLDDHRLYLILVHQFVSPGEIMFQSNRRDFIVNAQISGWEQVDHAVEPGFGTLLLDTYDAKKKVDYPLVLFSIDYSRFSVRYILSILLPLMMVFYLILFSFSVDPNPSITLSAGGVTGILAYRFVIENMSPQAANFMISDYLFLLFLAGSCFVFFLNIIDIVAIRIPLIVKEVVVCLMYIIVTICSIYLFWKK
jgi:hypothetical protein